MKALCGESVWETGDRKSSPLSSRRQPPTFTNHLSVLIAAITQGDNKTHSGPDPPQNSLLLRIIRLYCIYSAATVWTTKWARWDSGWTDRLRICPDYAVIGSQAHRHGGNPAEGNTSQGGRHDTAGQHVNGAPTNAREGFLRAASSVPRFLNHQRNNCSGSTLQHPPRHQLTRIQSIIWVFSYLVLFIFYCKYVDLIWYVFVGRSCYQSADFFVTYSSVFLDYTAQICCISASENI